MKSPRRLFLWSAGLGLAATLSAPAQAESIIGLSSFNSLVFFDSSTPGAASGPTFITGLNAGEQLLDIDIRPADQQLYALGRTGTIYTVDPGTGAATVKSSLSVALGSALEFGIDFNPVPDRLRIVSTSGQNLRVNVDTGAVTVDSPLSGAATGAASVAYTNPDTNPNTGTTLYYLQYGTAADLLTTTNPNGGVTTLVGSTGTASNVHIGFDISGFSTTAFATLSDPLTGFASLYTVDLASGGVSLVGAIGSPGLPYNIYGIATQTTIPEATSLALLGGVTLAVGMGLIRRRRAQ